MSQEGSEAGVPVVAAFHHPAFACVSQGGSTVPGSPKRNQRGLPGTDEGHCRRHPRPTKTHPRGAAAGGSEGKARGCRQGSLLTAETTPTRIGLHQG